MKRKICDPWAARFLRRTMFNDIKIARANKVFTDKDITDLRRTAFRMLSACKRRRRRR